jgi:hypothetical protein
MDNVALLENLTGKKWEDIQGDDLSKLSSIQLMDELDENDPNYEINKMILEKVKTRELQNTKE